MQLVYEHVQLGYEFQHKLQSSFERLEFHRFRWLKEEEQAKRAEVEREKAKMEVSKSKWTNLERSRGYYLPIRGRETTYLLRSLTDPVTPCHLSLPSKV